MQTIKYLSIMKKTLIYAAAAALLALVACKKEDPVPPVQDTVKVTPTTVTIPGDGGSARLAIETNAESVSVESSDAWLTATLSGKELEVKADANPALTERKATVTVKAGTATASVSVTQEKGSKYPGYAPANLGQADYSGIFMLKMFGLTEYEGGQMALQLISEDNRYAVNIECFTECFTAPEQVELTVGTYTKGSDSVTGGYVGKALTWAPGELYVIEDEEDGDEELQYGSYLATTVGEEVTVTQLTGGTITVSKENGVYTIKTDLKDEKGNDVKFYYEGAVEINTDAAAYPGEAQHGDPTQGIIAAEIVYQPSEEDGTSVNLQLNLYTEAGLPATTFSFWVNPVSFEALPGTDLSGSYYLADEETGTAPGDPMTVDGGILLDLGGFSFPMGSYITFGLMDYFVPTNVSLVLERQADGKYTIAGMMADDSFSEFYLFADPAALEIEYTDGFADDEED